MTTCIPRELADDIRRILTDKKIQELAEGEANEISSFAKKYLGESLGEKFSSGFQARTIRAKDLDNIELNWDKKITENLKAFAENDKPIRFKIGKGYREVSADEYRRLWKERAMNTMKKRQSELLMRYSDTFLEKTKGEVKKNLIDKIAGIDYLLTPKNQESFFEELVASKLGFGVSAEQAQEISVLAKEAKKGLDANRAELESTVAKAKEYFNNIPRNKKRFEIADKIADRNARALEMEKLEAEARHYAEDIYLGVKNVDGTASSDAAYKRIVEERIKNSNAVRALSEYTENIISGMNSPELKRMAIEGAEGFEKFKKTADYFLSKLGQKVLGIKAIKATADLSGTLRQAYRIITNPVDWSMLLKGDFRGAVKYGDFGIWAKAAGGSIKDFAKVIGKKNIQREGTFLYKEGWADDVYNALRNELYSRPNALNGKWAAAKNGYALNIFREEQFPASVGENLRLFGRLHKGSEVAFNSLALRLRADLADKYIRQLELQGVNMLDKAHADALGHFVSAITGRGHVLGREEFAPAGKILNVALFSPRYIGSQFHMMNGLYKPMRGAYKTLTPIEKLHMKHAWSNIATMGLAMIAAHNTSKLFGGDGVDFNPTSATFGHLRVGDAAFDLTGGMGGYVKLVSRMFTGEWYDYKSRSYQKRQYYQDSYGLISDWFQGKASPVASLGIAFLNGKFFGGEDFTIKSLITDPIKDVVTGEVDKNTLRTHAKLMSELFAPITVENMFENSAYVKDGESAVTMAAIVMADFFGIGAKDAHIKPLGKEWKALLEKDKDLYTEASIKLTEQIQKDVKKLQSMRGWDKMTKEERAKEADKLIRKQKKNIVDVYLRKAGIKQSDL